MSENPFMSQPIFIFKNLREEGPEYCAVIKSSRVGPFFGPTAIAAKRAAVEWREREVEKAEKIMRRQPRTEAAGS